MKQRIRLASTVILASILVAGAGCKRGRNTANAAPPGSSSGSTSQSSDSNSGSPEKQKPKRGVGVFAVKDREKMQGKFRNLGLAYIAYETTSDKPPTSADDLKNDGSIDKETYDWIKEGYIVVYWNAKLGQLDNKTQTVLAYENADVSGGAFVLMADGAVKRMTDGELDKAPKAGTLKGK
jgi:hypothetical protein